MEGSSVDKSEQSQHYYEPTMDAPTNTKVDVAVEINYTDSNQQDHYQPQFMPPQQQQEEDYRPPQQQQQQQQSQAQQYPTQPQTSQAYGAQVTARPIQFPHPAPGSQPIPLQPEQFPPQNPNQPAAYPPQPAQFPPQNPTQPAAYPPQPAQFPPQNPTQPAAYPPQAPQWSQPQPVQFPPQPAPYPPQGPQPTSGTYPPEGKPPVYLPQGQAFTQAAYQSPQPQAFSYAPQGAAQGYTMSTPPYKPPAAEGIPLGKNQMLQQQNYNEQWTTGLFDCMEDPKNAVLTACFPCVTFGQISEIIDNGQTTCSNNGLFYGLIAACIAIPCIMSFGYRTKLRAKYGLVEAPGPDWAVHFIFEWCALCQEYRELQNRGFDPAIGWQGNVMRQSMQQQQVAMMPPMHQQMMP